MVACNEWQLAATAYTEEQQRSSDLEQHSSDLERQLDKVSKEPSEEKIASKTASREAKNAFKEAEEATKEAKNLGSLAWAMHRAYRGQDSRKLQEAFHRLDATLTARRRLSAVRRLDTCRRARSSGLQHVGHADVAPSHRWLCHDAGGCAPESAARVFRSEARI